MSEDAVMIRVTEEARKRVAMGAAACGKTMEEFSSEVLCGRIHPCVEEPKPTPFDFKKAVTTPWNPFSK